MLGKLPRWEKLATQCQEAGETWPLPDSRQVFAAEWLKLAQGDPAAPWTKVTLVNEARLTPEKFVERFTK
jgi:hypothetical protein